MGWSDAYARPSYKSVFPKTIPSNEDIDNEYANDYEDKTAEDGVDETDAEVDAQAKSDNTNTRSLSSFGYALQGEQAVDGVVLTQNSAAINFRNFLLSSTGQDILSQHNYTNIDGYKNDMDNLFQPSSRAKQATGELSVDVSDALSNGK